MNHIRSEESGHTVLSMHTIYCKNSNGSMAVCHFNIIMPPSRSLLRITCCIQDNPRIHELSEEYHQVGGCSHKIHVEHNTNFYEIM